MKHFRLQTRTEAHLTAVCALALFLAWGGLGTGCDRGQPEPSTAPAPVVTQVPQGGTLTPKTLILGITPYLNNAQLQREFSPLAKHLGEAVGIPVELRIAESYEQLAQWMVAYEVHVGVLSPLNYVRAKRLDPGIILLATHIADGASTYSAYIVTPAGSDIQNIRDLKGKRFAYVDEHSTSGYLYPRVYLHNLGLDPDTLFASTVFAGSHSKVIEWVANGKVDAGATFSTAYKLAEERRLKILAKTGRIPYDAYCATPRLERTIVEKLRTVLLALNTRTKVGRKVLGGMTNINGFVHVSDEHYDDVRRLEGAMRTSGKASP